MYDTIRERDIDVNRDMIITSAARGSRGQHVKVRHEEICEARCVLDSVFLSTWFFYSRNMSVARCILDGHVWLDGLGCCKHEINPS